MTNVSPQKVNIIDVIRENFALVVAIVSIIGSWAFFQFQMTDNEKRISALESSSVKQTDDMSDIKGSIKEINAKLDLLINNKIK
jgi:hypothetical protein